MGHTKRARAKPAIPGAGEDIPRHAMRGTWIDPDDIKPDAKKAPRLITGWRSGDPLRRMLVHHASGITAQHISAADKLREAADIAVLGYSAERPLIYVSHLFLPRAGMGHADLARTKAWRVVARAVKLFAVAELEILQAVVLRNISLRAWCAARDPPRSQLVEKRRLLRVLDSLVDHFDAEVQDDLARGRRLPP
jgi:hypothetical protein